MRLLLMAALAAAAPQVSPNGLPVSDTNLPSAVTAMMEHSFKVAPHVWAIHAAASSGLAPLANEMVVEQRDGLVLIDTGKTRGAGKRIVALIKSISNKPVKAVILTHWHQDHVLGLGPIVEAWPGVPIIATKGTAGSIDSDPSYADYPTAPGQTARRDAARAAAFKQYAKDYMPKVLDRTLTARQHEGWAALVGVLDQRALDEKGTYLVHPTKIFAGRYTIDDPDAPVEAIEVGQGHSVSDSVAWVPRQRVVATGDQVVSPAPFGGSHLVEWPAALGRIIALNPNVVVPGHGAILKGTAYLHAMRRMIEGVDREVRSLPRSPLLSDDEVRQRVSMTSVRRAFTHGDPWLGDLFDQFTADYPVLAYHELTGQKP